MHKESDNRKDEYDRKINYLRQYLNSQNRILGHLYELEKWETIGTKITQNYGDRIPARGENQSKIESSGINMAILSKDIQKEIATALNLRDEVYQTISKAPTKRHCREILTMKFINGLSNRKIAILLDRDERSIRRMIRNAVLSIEA